MTINVNVRDSPMRYWDDNGYLVGYDMSSDCRYVKPRIYISLTLANTRGGGAVG